MKSILSFFLLSLFFFSFTTLSGQKQIDFSKEWLVPGYEMNGEGKDVTQKIIQYDLSTFFNTDSTSPSKYGILGNTYQRFRVRIYEVARDPLDQSTYNIKGFSKTKNHICDFSGKIQIKKIYEYESTSDSLKTMVVASEFFFKGTPKQFNSGAIKGSVQTKLAWNKVTGQLSFLPDPAANNMNNTFVGLWKGYRTGDQKKCIWGIGKLPFIDDFLIYDDNKARPNPAYDEFGWNGPKDEQGNLLDTNEQWWKKK